MSISFLKMSSYILRRTSLKSNSIHTFESLIKFGPITESPKRRATRNYTLLLWSLLSQVNKNLWFGAQILVFLESFPSGSDGAKMVSALGLPFRR